MAKPTFSELAGALEDMFSLIEDQWLVRNTIYDEDRDFYIKQLPFVQKLANCRRLLNAAQEYMASPEV